VLYRFYENKLIISAAQKYTDPSEKDCVQETISKIVLQPVRVGRFCKPSLIKRFVLVPTPERGFTAAFSTVLKFHFSTPPRFTATGKKFPGGIA